jgi:hypothetical protein
LNLRGECLWSLWREGRQAAGKTVKFIMPLPRPVVGYLKGRMAACQKIKFFSLGDFYMRYAQIVKIIFECPNCKKQVETPMSETALFIEKMGDDEDVPVMQIECPECGENFYGDFTNY